MVDSHVVDSCDLSVWETAVKGTIVHLLDIIAHCSNLHILHSNIVNVFINESCRILPEVMDLDQKKAF